MNDAMNICGTDVTIKEWHEKRVVTFKDIDMVHQRPKGTARKRFNDNHKRFISGVDFYKISPSEFRTAIGNMDNRQQNDVTLITESGYLMLVKSFTDDLAWKVQRELVDSYFRVKEHTEPIKQDIQVSVMQPEIFLEAARIMASVPDSQRYVINCLRHIVPDIDELPTVTVQTEDAVIDSPVATENVIVKVRAESSRRGCSIPFNDRKLDIYMSDNNITADKLSEMSGVCYSLINRYRKGETSPGSENRRKITQALQLPDGYFDKRIRNRRS